MLYRFVKKLLDGSETEFNVERIGAEDAESLEVVLQGRLDAGYVHAEAAEHDAQVIKGATMGTVPVQA